MLHANVGLFHSLLHLVKTGKPADRHSRLAKGHLPRDLEYSEKGLQEPLFQFVHAIKDTTVYMFREKSLGSLAPTALDFSINTSKKEAGQNSLSS